MADPGTDADDAVPEAFVEALRELGLAGSERLLGQPLAGGVSSDIWRIDTARGPVCAKRALPKLRVAADWHAPIERNLYEARWMQVAQAACPGCTAAVLGQHSRLGVLVMNYLDPSRYVLWKHALRDGHADVDTARAVGTMLVRIHAFSAARPSLAAEFPTDAIFFDIRLEPYLLAIAARHPDLAARMKALVKTTQANAVALVHGDVSPKNILVGSEGPVLIDAECAWWGDPAFDIAFCLNHLLLKCLWVPAATNAFLACFDALSLAYLTGVDWERAETLEQRAAALLPGLFLARVDGKSPVEYLHDEADRHRVRRVARRLIADPVDSLSQVAAAWRAELAS
ncbi:MAG TPA: phosphotransferase [Rubrivivax sp.]|nr:phosphotransferase [Rubrivivax sp.]